MVERSGGGECCTAVRVEYSDGLWPLLRALLSLGGTSILLTHLALVPFYALRTRVVLKRREIALAQSAAKSWVWEESWESWSRAESVRVARLQDAAEKLRESRLLVRMGLCQAFGPVFCCLPLIIVVRYYPQYWAITLAGEFFQVSSIDSWFC